MLVCHCILAGTAACRNCQRYIEHYGVHPSEQLYDYEAPTKVIKVKRIIEKFDKDGKLIERITEE
jgi:hypothetical protein